MRSLARVLGRQLRADVGVFGDHDKIVTWALTQRGSKLSLGDIAVRHTEALGPAVVLQHEEFVNLHQIHLLRPQGRGARYCACPTRSVKSERQIRERASRVLCSPQRTALDRSAEVDERVGAAWSRTRAHTLERFLRGVRPPVKEAATGREIDRRPR